MQITPTDIPDVLIITPKVFEDERGFFMNPSTPAIMLMLALSCPLSRIITPGPGRESYADCIINCSTLRASWWR